MPKNDKVTKTLLLALALMVAISFMGDAIGDNNSWIVIAGLVAVEICISGFRKIWEFEIFAAETKLANRISESKGSMSGQKTIGITVNILYGVGFLLFAAVAAINVDKFALCVLFFWLALSCVRGLFRRWKGSRKLKKAEREFELYSAQTQSSPLYSCPECGFRHSSPLCPQCGSQLKI